MILVTGGAGYIGSHTVLELLQAGHEVVVYDNLCNGSVESLKRVESITGKQATFVEGDIRNADLLQKIFRDNDITAVVHFAGLKAVGESVAKPLDYYENNYYGSLVLVKVMQQFNVKQLVFSSSATVYGDPHNVPIDESFPTGQTTNPYGTSKYKVELMLKDLCRSDPAWSVIAMRYFNPVGAHSSGQIGENPSNIPNNLVPYIAQVAIGRLQALKVFGDDYATHDGTGVRDYIHIVDLAMGHLAALDKLSNGISFEAVNLGTGKGYSVLEMITAFEEASGQAIPYEIVKRRAGDIAACYANTLYAFELLGWKAQRSVAQMMEDTWRWQQNNPHGYGHQ